MSNNSSRCRVQRKYAAAKKTMARAPPTWLAGAAAVGTFVGVVLGPTGVLVDVVCGLPPHEWHVPLPVGIGPPVPVMVERVLGEGWVEVTPVLVVLLVGTLTVVLVLATVLLEAV